MKLSDTGKDKELIYQKIRDYVQTLAQSNVPIWRLYHYGSYAKNTYREESDIDLAVFWDRDDIDGFDLGTACPNIFSKQIFYNIP